MNKQSFLDIIICLNWKKQWFTRAKFRLYKDIVLSCVSFCLVGAGFTRGTGTEQSFLLAGTQHEAARGSRRAVRSGHRRLRSHGEQGVVCWASLRTAYQTCSPWRYSSSIRLSNKATIYSRKIILVDIIQFYNNVKRFFRFTEKNTLIKKPICEVCPFKSSLQGGMESFVA